MGTFPVTIELGDIDGQHKEASEAFVDTGSSYTFFPRPTLERLGIAVSGRRSFRSANEERVLYD